MQTFTLPRLFLRHPSDHVKNQSASDGWFDINMTFLHYQTSLMLVFQEMDTRSPVRDPQTSALWYHSNIPSRI